jgi:hypothetical protein
MKIDSNLIVLKLTTDSCKHHVDLEEAHDAQADRQRVAGDGKKDWNFTEENDLLDEVVELAMLLDDLDEFSFQFVSFNGVLIHASLRLATANNLHLFQSLTDLIQMTAQNIANWHHLKPVKHDQTVLNQQREESQRNAKRQYTQIQDEPDGLVWIGERQKIIDKQTLLASQREDEGRNEGRHVKEHEAADGQQVVVELARVRLLDQNLTASRVDLVLFVELKCQLEHARCKCLKVAINEVEKSRRKHDNYWRRNERVQELKIVNVIAGLIAAVGEHHHVETGLSKGQHEPTIQNHTVRHLNANDMGPLHDCLVNL